MHARYTGCVSADGGEDTTRSFERQARVHYQAVVNVEHVAFQPLERDSVSFHKFCRVKKSFAVYGISVGQFYRLSRVVSTIDPPSVGSNHTVEKGLFASTFVEADSRYGRGEGLHITVVLGREIKG